MARRSNITSNLEAEFSRMVRQLEHALNRGFSRRGTVNNQMNLAQKRLAEALDDVGTNFSSSLHTISKNVEHLENQVGKTEREINAAIRAGGERDFGGGSARTRRRRARTQGAVTNLPNLRNQLTQQQSALTNARAALAEHTEVANQLRSRLNTETQRLLKDFRSRVDNSRKSPQQLAKEEADRNTRAGESTQTPGVLASPLQEESNVAEIPGGPIFDVFDEQGNLVGSTQDPEAIKAQFPNFTTELRSGGMTSRIISRGETC